MPTTSAVLLASPRPIPSCFPLLTSTISQTLTTHNTQFLQQRTPLTASIRFHHNTRATMQGNSSSASPIPSLIMDSSSFSSFSSSSSSSDLEIGRSPPFPISHPPVGSPYGLVRSRTPLRAVFFADATASDSLRHFLDSCFLCRKPLARDRDIFMYRGDLPFCSEECRHEQIEIDEGEEKQQKLSFEVSSWKESNKAQGGAVAESHEIQIRRTDAVAATI